MLRWNHLWLNEGFATFFSVYGNQAIYEKSFVWQLFYSTRSFSMDVDVDLKLYEKQTVPTVESIKKASEARFDFSQYPRGACMLAMVRSMLGEEIFLSTITNYLKNNLYSSTVSRDLFDQFLDPVARKAGVLPEGTNFRGFMEPWTNRSGYPVLSIVRNESDNTVRNITS